MDSDKSNDYTVTLSAIDYAASSPDYYDYDNIMASTIFNGGYQTSNTGAITGSISAAGGAGYPWGVTTSSTITAANPYDANVHIDGNGITMQGETDIKLGDMSLKKTLTAIEERLNILHPNKEMEAEWDELRELGERYRALEEECKKKSKMWGILKKN